MEVTAKADEAGRRAERSDTLDRAVRVGLVGYGVMHLLIAWLAARLVFGGGGNASAQGALGTLAQTTPGRVTLYVVGVGFAALAVWQLIEAVGGHRSADGAERWAKRGGSAVKVIVYGVLSVSSFTIAAGAGSGSGGTDSMTATLLSMPGGQVVVALIGVGVLVAAGVLGYVGASGSFTDKLTARGRSGSVGSAIIWSGRIGYLGKAVALAIVGGLFVWAGWTHDPHKSGGLDQALHQVLQAPLGQGVVMVIAVGIACFGVFCFGWARNLDT
ncbi:MAG TPA: DUF1206 domain-containing protein [Nocardioidaceae bacterium]|nr:DUF1206 domain-containing protein [Nocardioidaceae bacterium]